MSLFGGNASCRKPRRRARLIGIYEGRSPGWLSFFFWIW